MSTGANSKPSKKVVASRHIPLEILWWDRALLNSKSQLKAPLHWIALGEFSMGVMRSEWDNNKASYVALKGGTPYNSHGHMDAGSFILEANGVRWAIDLGTENYGKMREAKLDLWNYSQNSSRWSTFRVGSESHNILRFDNEPQEIDGRAVVTELPDVNGTMGNTADLSSLYSKKTKQVRRIILLHPDHSVSLKDEWITKDRAVEVSWQLLTRAKVKKIPTGLLLEQGGQSLHLKIEEPLPMDNLTIEILDVSKSKKTQDSDNPGVSRIDIKLRTPASSNDKLFIRAIPGKE
jgi:hypothetical protein